MNIAILAPHFDDAQLAMGGTIALLAAIGHTVTLVDMTNAAPPSLPKIYPSHV